MTELLEMGREPYGALARGDAKALGRFLAFDFQEHLSEGVPLGLGRRDDGSATMMGEGWGAVDQHLDVTPRADELLDGGSVLIGRGNDVGTARPTGRPLRAAFAQFRTFDGERFTAVRQVTDTAKWQEALAEA